MLELESVHVPKVGGTSFIEVLEGWYPGALRLSYRHRAHDDPGAAARAVHGHFVAGTHAAQRRITWLREPAARVVSHFFYWRQVGPDEQSPPLHTQMREQNMPLLEFAAEPSMRDQQSVYLGELRPRDLDFVGVIEQAPLELQRLAATLGLPAATMARRNETPSAEYSAFRASPAYETVLGQVRALNRRDLELYVEACDLMQQRRRGA